MDFWIDNPSPSFDAILVGHRSKAKDAPSNHKND